MGKKSKIKCPYCGYEYLPSEIYYRDEFLGKATNIIKDENGEILGFEGNDMRTKEEYICDNCLKNFRVDASIVFKTIPLEPDFEEEEDF